MSNSFETIILSSPEWESLPEIFKTTLHSLLQQTKLHSSLIKELELQLTTKPSKTELISSLATKQNTAEIMQTLNDMHLKIEAKVSNEDLNHILNEQTKQIAEMKNEIEIFKKNYVNKNFFVDSLHKKANKASLTTINNLLDENNKKIELIETRVNDTDKQIKSINEIQETVHGGITEKIENCVNVINELGEHKIDIKDVEAVKKDIMNEVDFKIFNSKNELCELVSKYRSDILLSNTNLSNEILGKSKSIDNKADKKDDKDELITFLQSQNEKIENEIHRINEIIKQNNDNEISFHNSIQSQISDLKQIVSRKSNMSDITGALNNKVDISTINTMFSSIPSTSDVNQMIQSTINSSLEEIISQASSVSSYDSVHLELQNITRTIAEIKDSLIMKANIIEVSSSLNTKLDKASLNSIIAGIREELDIKANEEELNTSLIQQKRINSILCGLNIIGKWKWTSGNLNNSWAKWEQQVANTAPDNFYWEKNINYITIRDEGIYQVECIIFEKGNKPCMRVLMDGKEVIGDALAATGWNCIDGVYGVSVKETIEVKGPTRISVGVAKGNESPANGILIIKSI